MECDRIDVRSFPLVLITNLSIVFDESFGNVNDAKRYAVTIVALAIGTDGGVCSASSAAFREPRRFYRDKNTVPS